MLIRHGSLMGFNDANPPRVVLRARRLFCSNRFRRRGCGRTISVFLVHTIRRSILHARTLLTFLRNVVRVGITAAINTISVPLSRRSLQRVWRRFRLAQSRIRTALFGRAPPPDRLICDAQHPAAAQLLEHLNASFPNSDNLIADYQSATASCFL